MSYYIDGPATGKARYLLLDKDVAEKLAGVRSGS